VGPRTRERYDLVGPTLHNGYLGCDHRTKAKNCQRIWPAALASNVTVPGCVLAAGCPACRRLLLKLKLAVLPSFAYLLALREAPPHKFGDCAYATRRTQWACYSAPLTPRHAAAAAHHKDSKWSHKLPQYAAEIRNEPSQRIAEPPIPAVWCPQAAGIQ